jgi:hypothetical protein
VIVANNSALRICTAIAQNFLPHARVLAESIAEHHPGCRLDVLVVDAPEPETMFGEPFRRVSPSELALPREELHRRLTLYDTAALLSSLRSPLLAGCLARGSGPVLYLDADMLVLGSLADVGELIARHGIVLTPHATVPLPFRAGGYGPEQTFLRAGVFNGGFLGVSPAAVDFLAWRDERVARDCVVAFDRGIFLGQAWLALVPALFDHHVLRDRGVNLLGPGLGADDLDWRGDRPWIGETPVRLFHFGGAFEPYSGELAPRLPDPIWPRTSERPGLARLCKEYGQRLLKAGYGSRPAKGHAWLDWAMRDVYRAALFDAETNGTAEPPNPFTHGINAFNAWLAEPAWPGSKISRYLAAIRAGRDDLRAHFTDIPGAHEDELLRWVASKYPNGLPDGLPTAVISL